MKPVFTVSITKRDAKRLMFFFPVILPRKGWSGRSYGKHGLDSQSRSEVTDQSRIKEFDSHYFGRSVRSMPTTNGVTVMLEYSLTCAQLRQEDAVIVQIFKEGQKWLFRIAPHRGLGEVGEDNHWHLCPWETRPVISCEPLTIVKESNRVRFKFGQREWDIRRSEITQAAFAVWDNDLWKYDFILSWDGERVIVQEGKDFKPTQTDNFIQEVVDLEESFE